MLNRHYLTSKSNNSSSSSKMSATNVVIKSQYDTLLDKQSMNSWLPLPHPCVFTSNWSSFHQFDLIKNYPLSCLHSKHTYESNSTFGLKESCLNIHKLGSMTKESTLNNDHDIEVNKECEIDLNIVQDENITNEYPNKEYEILPKEKKPILSIHKSTTPPPPPPHHHPLSMKKFTIRETTNLLKSWLDNHRYNPYPTKNEKIKLSLITHLSLTQISTWFANARRRLKKENQMTWIPKIRHHRIITTNSIHLNNQMCHKQDDDYNGNNTTNTIHLSSHYTTTTTDNHNSSSSSGSCNNNNTDQLPEVTSDLRSTIITNCSIHPLNNHHDHYHHHLTSLNSQLILKYFLNKNRQQQQGQEEEEKEERRLQKQGEQEEKEEVERRQKEGEQDQEEERQRQQREQQCLQIQDKLNEFSNILLNDINLCKITSIINKNTIENNNNNNNDLWNNDDNTKLIHMNPLIYKKNIDQYRLYCKSLESSESSSSSSVESTTTINSNIIIDSQRTQLNHTSKIWSVADVIDV